MKTEKEEELSKLFDKLKNAQLEENVKMTKADGSDVNRIKQIIPKVDEIINEHAIKRKEILKNIKGSVTIERDQEPCEISYEIKTYVGGIAVDDRGLVKFVNDFDFIGIKRFYQVENHRQGFIRAWHGHEFESKYVYVTSGTILLGLVNMNTEEITKYILSARTPKILYIPPGYYNGFKNLEENTSVIFFSTSTMDEAKDDDIRIPYDKWDIWKEDFR